MVDSVAPAGGGDFSGGMSASGIGSSGSTAFDLGGIAPNGGGPAPIDPGDLGTAGLGPIGGSGLTDFGPPGSGESEAAKAAQFDALAQQNTDMIKSFGQSNDTLSAFTDSLGQTPSLPSFTTQPLNPPSFGPMPSIVPNFTLPLAAGGAPTASDFAAAPTFDPAPTVTPFTFMAPTPPATDGAAAPLFDPAPIAQQPVNLDVAGGETPTIDSRLFDPAPLAGAPGAFGAGPIAPDTEGFTLPAAAQPTSPIPFAGLPGLAFPALPPADPNAANLYLDPVQFAQRGLDGEEQAPAQPSPQIGYGDAPFGGRVSQLSGLSSADAQTFVGGRMDAYQDAATPAEQDQALGDALDAAYAYRVQGGDTGPFDRIAERIAGDPRAEAETKVARDRAEAIIDAGVSGNIRVLNDNGVNFGARLLELQRAIGNDPDNAIVPITAMMDSLRYGEGNGSAVNATETSATRQALTALGYGQELQTYVAADDNRTLASQVEERQALATMSPSERFSYLLGKAADAGALTAGPALAMAIAGGARGPYANLTDSPSVGTGKSFTGAQKAKIYQQNLQANGGELRSDMDGTPLVMPTKSRSGVTPPGNEAQIDHIDPRVPRDPNTQAGTNSFGNAQVLSREQNRTKSNR